MHLLYMIHILCTEIHPASTQYTHRWSHLKQSCFQNQKPLGGTLTYFTSIIIVNNNIVHYITEGKENPVHDDYTYLNAIIDHIYSVMAMVLILEDIKL